ncbi:MAG TPA: substrate-binding domain-containing protein [Candidatus Onthenecus intestinigallinarum]|uniref:Substrate-binding domain-containing protein n=1 Tax=Candidatus Onthenecus intestinigallinarum TaxID=2840875 RepID=A0A9D0Z7J3_9FIRM|nr:substrate-binding domain-containing protein [Candidatus Onthenecus intestinigallinarum]
MKKFFAVMLALALCASSASALAASGAITVVSREDGSGTRGAFVELMGVEVKAEDGSKADMTTEEAVIANSTDVVMQNVASDPNAIGYISLGSLNETVKAVSVDGVAPSVETVADGSYKVARPFYIATKGEPGELAADFIAFILSAEGQAVVGESYIKVDDAAPAFEGALPEGKLVIAGSSSVTPVMEKLVEAYLALNDKATIEIQMSDSTAGMTGAIDGTCDIGMASRELKESEAAELNGTVIAMDGIAVVVNNDSDVQNLTSEQVRAIYTGEIEDWADVQ